MYLNINKILTKMGRKENKFLMMKGKLKKAVALVTALSCVQISPLAVTEVEAAQDAVSATKSGNIVTIGMISSAVSSVFLMTGFPRQKLRTCLEIQCSHREKIQKNL